MRLYVTKETGLGRIVYTRVPCPSTFLKSKHPDSLSILLSLNLSLLSPFFFFFLLGFIHSLSYTAFPFALWTKKVQRREREGTETHGLFMWPGFINGNWKRSQKNLCFFLVLLSWRGPSEVPAHPREVARTNCLLIHWLTGVKGRARPSEIPLVVKALKPQAAVCSRDGFSVTFQQLISFKNWIKAVKGFCQMEVASSWVFGSGTEKAIHSSQGQEYFFQKGMRTRCQQISLERDPCLSTVLFRQGQLLGGQLSHTSQPVFLTTLVWWPSQQACSHSELLFTAFSSKGRGKSLWLEVISCEWQWVSVILFH